jgi:predicted SnoaL-like aldol condensation-catalyzing enzyme
MKRTIVLLALLKLGAFGCATAGSGPALARNKALVERTHKEVWSHGDMAAADQIYARDFVAHWTGGPDCVGIENFKTLVTEARGRAPDLKETIEQIVAEGDLVVTRFTSRGTFASEPGEPSKYKDATMREIAIHRIQAGKIAEQWTVGAILEVRPVEAAPSR